MPNKINYVLLFCCFLQGSWCRSLSLSFNASLLISDDRPMKFSPALLQHCMKETAASLVELQHFRDTLYKNDRILYNGIENEINGLEEDSNDDETAAEAEADGTTITDNNIGDSDTDGFAGINQYSISDDFEYRVGTHAQDSESLQCFVQCLYEQMGLIGNDIFKEQQLFRKLFTLIIEREKRPVKECMDLESEKKCEAAYKMHLCYSRLKSLDAERRIREILEHETYNNDNENTVDMEMDDNPENNEISRQ